MVWPYPQIFFLAITLWSSSVWSLTANEDMLLLHPSYRNGGLETLVKCVKKKRLFLSHSRLRGFALGQKDIASYSLLSFVKF
jgi:hypothetical protein